MRASCVESLVRTDPCRKPTANRGRGAIVGERKFEKGLGFPEALFISSHPSRTLSSPRAESPRGRRRKSQPPHRSEAKPTAARGSRAP